MDLFADALDVPTAERREFLDSELADEATLRGEVEALLEADSAAGDFLETPALETPSLETTTLGPGSTRRFQAPLAEGDRLGPWEVVRPIGEGGMGAVFLAVRADEFRQRVAIKVSRPFASSELRRRFRAERQILADLDHPYIARLLDGGTTESGLPYLVMDHIEGEPIDVYCHRRELSRVACIELFEEACTAVQYAHRMLVVHRDIKPSNLLVTQDGTPKLLDFGIAKLLRSSTLDEAARVETRHGYLPLTPNYASPEQWRGEPLTTATDVYSLGVLLYRLLTGRMPREFGSTAPVDVERTLRDQEPTPPGLDRDLDGVLLRALATDPRERYGTVESFAEDLERYRLGLPVRARSQTLGYRAGKLLRRHRVAASAALVGLLTLTGFSVDKARQAKRLAVERDVSRAEEAKAEELSSFLTGLLHEADPWESEGKEPSVRQVLDRGVREIERRFAAQDEVRAGLLDVMGLSYLGLARYEESADLLERALRLRRRILPPGDRDLAATLVHLGGLYLQRGDYARARPPLAEAIISLRQSRVDLALLAEALESDSMLHVFQGDLEEAEVSAREALAWRVEADATPLDAAASRRQLALVLIEKGALEEASEQLDVALEVVLAELGEEHPRTTLLQGRLAALRRRLGDLEGAETLLRSILVSRRKIFDEDHFQVGQAKNDLAAVLVMRGTLDEAERLYREILATAEPRLGEDHRDMAVVHNNLGRLLHEKGDADGARRHLRQSLDMVRRSLPPGHPGAAHPMLQLGTLEMDAGNPRAAEPLFREGLALRLAALPETHALIADSRKRLGECLLASGRPEEAEPLLVAAYGRLDDPAGKAHAAVAGQLLARLYRDRGEPERAAMIEARLSSLSPSR